MFLALREMKHAKLRYTLIGLIMVLISWLVLFVSGLAQGLSSDNAASIQSLDANYFVLEKEANHRLNRSVLLADTIQQLNPKEATPIGIRMATVKKEGSTKKIDATFFSIKPNSFAQPEVVEGEMIDDMTTNEVMVDQSLKNEGFRLGDIVKDEASGKEFKIVGFTKNQSFSHAPVIHLNFKEWDMIHDLNANEKSFFNVIALQADEREAKELTNHIADIEVITKEEALKGIPGFKEEQGSLLMMIVFLFVIAAFVLAVFFYVITIQKLNQFGVLKAIGAKSSYLAKNILSQVVILTVVSLVISIALTYGMAFLLPATMPFSLSLPLVLGCSILFIVVSIVGSLLSLYRVAKIDAIEAIGRAA